MSESPLAGVAIATTRDRPGRLDAKLEALGADIVHIPLIDIVDLDDRSELIGALARLEQIDWLVVTSQHGAARVGDAARRHPKLRLAAVGASTAATLADLAGRPVDVSPQRQTGADLAAALEPWADGASVVIAQADRADRELADRLRDAGATVTAVTAYRTRLRHPSKAELAAVRRVDAVAFMSGSAALSWRKAIGAWTPPIVVAIGPRTAAAARDAGLQVSHVCQDHSLTGVCDTLVEVFGEYA